MNKNEYEMCFKLNETTKKLSKLFFKQKQELNKLYDYIELRKLQLRYIESKEEIDFILECLKKIKSI